MSTESTNEVGAKLNLKLRTIFVLVLVASIFSKISRASIKTVNDLFNKTVAIDAAEISNDLMMKMVMELEDPDTEEPAEEAEVEEEATDRPDNSWSWRDLKTTVARSFNHYRKDYGRGLCLVGYRHPVQI